MKRKRSVLIAILFGILAFVLLKPHGTEWNRANISQEKILEEMPEISFSLKDRAAMDALMNLPEISQYGGSDQFEDLPAEMLEPFLEELCAEDATEFHGMYREIPQRELVVSFLFGEEKQMVLSMQEDGTFLKVISLYDGKNGGTYHCTENYENRNGFIQKLVPKKQWF